MPDYYVVVDIKEGRKEGYILAENRDVALVSFLAKEDIPEDDVHDDSWTVTKVYHLRMDRLSDFLGEPDPWGCDVEFDPSMIGDDDGTVTANTSNDDFTSPVTNHRWHAARILYLTRHPDQLLNPVEVDNQCFGGRIYPIPKILDGWHRYYAHLHLGFDRIRCTYGGLVDLLHYLEGKTDELPCEDGVG